MTYNIKMYMYTLFKCLKSPSLFTSFNISGAETMYSCIQNTWFPMLQE